jgi:hypothetical protein
VTTVHARPEYQIAASGPPPPGYPEQPAPSDFAETPFRPDYASRREAFLDHLRRNPAPANTKAGWHELGRLAAGAVPHEGVLHAALDFIDARRDCADFVLHGILRLLYQFGGAGSPLSPGLLERGRQTLLGFKYFPGEPGGDSMCTWTENHYVLFASAAYLAGQLYPDRVFTNSGETGREKMAASAPRLRRWLDLRFRTGFSEWLSHVYYDEDLTALLALADFCQDPDLRQRAAMVIDLLLLDLALNSFRGVFGSTHGRAYGNTKRWAAQEGTTDTSRLLFGTGVFSGYDNMSAIALALSGYRVPPVIEAIAHDQDRPALLNRQRMGLRLAEAERFGLDPPDFESSLHLLTLEAYLHPRTAAQTLYLFDRFGWWQNDFFRPLARYRGLLRGLQAAGLLGGVTRWLEWDACRNTREQVDVVTYRTPDYMLSSAPDYRPVYGGDQQHIWQATLGPNAVCFTTHPGRLGGPTPDEWAGSGILPRVAQYQNVLLAVYRLHHRPALYVPTRHRWTHAWLPLAEFDEVVEQGGWVLARKGRGYLALRSLRPAHWQTAGPEAGAELIAPGSDNAWICELGRQAVDGSFEDFARRITLAPLLVHEDGGLTYGSPSQGILHFGWQGPFLRNGQPVDLHPNVRYANPYVRADFPSDYIEVRHAGFQLTLDWASGTREVDGRA